jgi:methyltransferase (TIGR00027 family)
MQPGQPSLTALGAARLRAAHQVLDGASILVDPLAARILGPNIQASIDHAQAHVAGPRIRWFIAARSRISEDALLAAARNGVTQLVVLGAGLDTLAYRTPLAGQLRIFEVDHPATQAWKRDRLEAAGIAIPKTLTFIAADFERHTLAERLDAAGFDPGARSFFSWLGVVPYLTEQAVVSTLGFLARLPGGSEVVFDYVNPAESVEPAGRAALQAMVERVAALGERFRSSFETDWMCSTLSGIGFRHLDDIGPTQLAARFYPEAERLAPGRGGHVMRAATI